MKFYELFLNWKQGDDFAQYLEHGASVSDALRSWGEHFKSCTEVCNNLAEAFQNKNITVQAETHMIMFDGDKEVLEEAAKNKLLTVYEDEEDEENEDDADMVI